MFKKDTTNNLARPSSFFRALLLLAFLGSSLQPIQTALAQDSDPVIRINAGTEIEESSDGVTFIGDIYFSTDSGVGGIVNNAIDNTTHDAIYQSERISNGSFAPFGYAVPVDNGTYSVVLHFAETAFQNVGQRVFNVAAEGITVLEDYDILEQAGAANTAIQETILNLNVSDGVLNIDFISVTERAKISAIEIMGTVAPVSIPFALNAGGAAYESTSLSWQADDGTYFLEEGMPFVNSISINGTEDDPLYEAERFNPDLRFVLPGFERGNYTIELHFAETNHQMSDQRVFDVTIEGETVLNDYDIFVASGGFATAVIEEFQDTPILDGILNISLNRSVGSATINAIAVTGASSVANESFSDQELPGSHTLTAAYPNPFNPQTRFTLSVAATQDASINVFNLLGQQVRTLYAGMMTAQQERAFAFDAASLPSGIYLTQVRGEHFLETQQVTLLK